MDYFSQFKPLLTKLKEQADAHSWAEFLETEELFRHKVADASNSLSDETERKSFEVTLERLQKIVGLIQADVKAYHDEIALELAKVSKEQKAAKSYLNFVDLK